MHISILRPGRSQPITYPPPQDIRYGELVALRNRAQKLGYSLASADLQHRLDHFFDKPEVQKALPL